MKWAALSEMDPRLHPSKARSRAEPPKTSSKCESPGKGRRLLGGGGLELGSC